MTTASSRARFSCLRLDIIQIPAPTEAYLTAELKPAQAF
jgi:hypothetical protein